MPMALFMATRRKASPAVLLPAFEQVGVGETDSTAKVGSQPSLCAVWIRQRRGAIKAHLAL
jgi:hypothetical protein